MVYEHNREKQHIASSADHPAFKVDYAPNYLASTEAPPEPSLPGQDPKARR